MTEIRPNHIDTSDSPPSTQSGTGRRFDRAAALSVTVLGMLSFAFWWPTIATVARYAFLCFFPAIFPFCYALVRSAPSFRERKHKILTIMLVVHCTLLLALAFAWKEFPSSVSIGNPDVVFGFMAIEVMVMALLVRLSGNVTHTNET